MLLRAVGHSDLKNINHGIRLHGFKYCLALRCSLEGTMLKLKVQYFGHLMQRVDSLEKTLMLGGIWGRRRGEGTTEDEMAG